MLLLKYNVILGHSHSDIPVAEVAYVQLGQISGM